MLKGLLLGMTGGVFTRVYTHTHPWILYYTTRRYYYNILKTHVYKIITHVCTVNHTIHMFTQIKYTLLFKFIFISLHRHVSCFIYIISPDRYCITFDMSTISYSISSILFFIVLPGYPGTTYHMYVTLPG